MAIFLPVLTVVASATVQVVTKPWPWLLLAVWVVASQFDLGVFAEESRRTLASLWWLVALIVAGGVAREYLRVKFRKEPPK